MRIKTARVVGAATAALLLVPAACSRSHHFSHADALHMCKTIMFDKPVAAAKATTVSQLRKSGSIAAGSEFSVLSNAFPTLRPGDDAAWCFVPLAPNQHGDIYDHYAAYAVAAPLNPIHVTDNVRVPKGTAPVLPVYVEIHTY